MKKKILIVIHNLDAGGAQKSLISFLNTLPDSSFDIDLLAIDTNGILFDQIPSYVNNISAPKELKCLAYSLKSESFLNEATLKLFLLKCIIAFNAKLFKFSSISLIQFLWKKWDRYIPKLSNQYDVGISYMDGFCNYYVVEKVSAKRKILWIHNDYNKLDYNSEFDKFYFKKADALVTISSMCASALRDNFAEYSHKILTIENISSPSLLKRMSLNDNLPQEYKRVHKPILISVGRFSSQKGFDIAISAANMLRQKGFLFTWFFIGEGPDKKYLWREVKKNDLNDYVKFLGVKANPYPYIAKADIFIQPSRFEGKSIVLDEAMILCKPIVVTNYSTVHDSVQQDFTALISELNPESLSNNIERLILDESLCNLLKSNLGKLELGNESEIIKYMCVINGEL